MDAIRHHDPGEQQLAASLDMEGMRPGSIASNRADAGLMRPRREYRRGEFPRLADMRDGWRDGRRNQPSDLDLDRHRALFAPAGDFL